MSGGAMEYAYNGVENARFKLERVGADMYARADEGSVEADDEEARARQKRRLKKVGDLTGDLAGLLRSIECCWSGDKGFADWEKEYERVMNKWGGGATSATTVVPRAKLAQLREVRPGTLIQMRDEPGWLLASTHPRHPERNATCSVLRIPHGEHTDAELDLVGEDTEVIEVEGEVVIDVNMQARTQWLEWLEKRTPGVMAMDEKGWHLAALRKGSTGTRTDWYRCATGEWITGWMPQADIGVYAVSGMKVRLEGKEGTR